MKRLTASALTAAAVLLVACGAGCRRDGRPRVTLESGEVNVGDEIATPLTVSTGVSQKGRVVDFTLVCTDALGRGVRRVSVGGRWPAPPRVTVTDAAGEVVYQCTLEYG